MAGSISATTAALIAAGVDAAGVGAGLYSSMKASDAQQQSLKQQTQATQTAEAASLSTERKNELATNAANAKAPDISDIMARAAQAQKTGAGSTMFTGSGGVAPGSLNLGKTSLLGS